MYDITCLSNGQKGVDACLFDVLTNVINVSITA